MSDATGFRFAVNTNSLRKGLSIPELADLCVEVGADGVEWGLPPLEEAAAAAKEMAQVSADRGLGIAGYINAGHLWKTDLMRQWSDALAPAGVKSVRVAPPWMAYNFDEALHQRAGYLEMLRMTREGLEKLVPLSKEYGIRYVIETHAGNVAAAPAVGRHLVEGLDPTAVGFIYDAANGLAEGGLRPRNDVELLGPYLAYLHGKNMHPVREEADATPCEVVKRASWRWQTCLLQEGMVDWVEVFYAVKLAGWTGWVALEEFFKVDAPAPVIRDGIEFLKACAAAAPSVPEEPFTAFND